jgi:phosphoribosylaminoimidazole carboxylase (NCAIR synthetase)
VDVVTYEFENIRADAVEHLEKKRVPVYPSSKVLRTCQDRVAEKTFVSSLQIETAPFQPVDNVEDLKKAIKLIGTPAILKSNTMGYDGKGQVLIKEGDDLQAAFEKMQSSSPPSFFQSTSRAILESFVDFEQEVSVIIARGVDHEQVVYPVVENEHRHHILHKTSVPANIDENVHQSAVNIGMKSTFSHSFTDFVSSQRRK